MLIRPAGCWAYIMLFTTANGFGAVLQLMVVVSGAYGLAFNGSQLPAPFIQAAGRSATLRAPLHAGVQSRPESRHGQDDVSRGDKRDLQIRRYDTVAGNRPCSGPRSTTSYRDAYELCPATTVACLQIFCGVVVPLYISYWHERTLKESWVAMVAPTAEAEACLQANSQQLQQRQQQPKG
jgi:hypothetical protein